MLASYQGAHIGGSARVLLELVGHSV